MKHIITSINPHTGAFEYLCNDENDYWSVFKGTVKQFPSEECARNALEVYKGAFLNKGREMRVEGKE